ncbi:hypothetical protein GNY06_00425 [Elizabethkingia argentiflava]|uniref:Uncharacterized protein n=1 Tax=Elizabethkingia argenteiflava TaxID=2681556 RepID=A0A845PP92_9FLAO|nr:hypothetical protein [Elizabethkingia argenteiflava]NAW49922.1 hypothetical protein [Elizabethkingia argenteiflava]
MKKSNFQKQSFEALTKKMNSLTSTEKGQLKGGFQPISTSTQPVSGSNGVGCTCNTKKGVGK